MGAGVPPAPLITEYAYDALGLLTNEAIWYIEGTVSNHWNLARSVDAFGRPSGYNVDGASSSVSYGYDRACPV